MCGIFLFPFHVYIRPFVGMQAFNVHALPPFRRQWFEHMSSKIHFNRQLHLYVYTCYTCLVLRLLITFHSTGLHIATRCARGRQMGKLKLNHFHEITADYFTQHVFKCTIKYCFWKILAWNRHSFVLVLRLFITFHSTCLHIALGVPELARWENWNLIIFMKSLPIWNKLYSTCIQMHYKILFLKNTCVK